MKLRVWVSSLPAHRSSPLLQLLFLSKFRLAALHEPQEEAPVAQMRPCFSSQAKAYIGNLCQESLECLILRKSHGDRGTSAPPGPFLWRHNLLRVIIYTLLVEHGAVLHLKSARLRDGKSKANCVTVASI